MKTSIPTPQPALWPSNKAGVLKVAQDWMDTDLVQMNDAAFATVPAGSIKAPESTNLTIDGQPGSLAPAIEYSIAMNSINYMFWRLGAQGQFERYGLDGKVGAEAMGRAFGQAWHDPQSPISLARQGVALTAESIQAVFGDIPDADSRAKTLNEILAGPKLGKVALDIALQASAGETFSVAQAAALAEAFPYAYGDEVLKKAQLAVSAMWRNAGERGLDLGCELTAFADYQIPNVLRALGLLAYSDELAQKIDAYQLIGANSPEERALRGASIMAVERLAQEHGVNVADVDYWLWTKRKEPKTPFHLTETTLY